MKKLILLFTTILSLSSFLKAEYVLEEALTQKGKFEPIEENDQYTIYRVVPDDQDNFYWPYLLKVDKRILEKDSSVIMFEMLNTGFPSDSMRFNQERALQSICWGYKYDGECKRGQSNVSGFLS